MTTKKTWQETLREYNEMVAEMNASRAAVDAARASLPKFKTGGKGGVAASLTETGTVKLAKEGSYDFHLPLNDAIHIARWILENADTEEDYRWTT